MNRIFKEEIKISRLIYDDNTPTEKKTIVLSEILNRSL